MTKIQKHASELMPRGETELRVLSARAEQLAKKEINVQEVNGTAYVRFQLGTQEHYGISYQYVHEILRHIAVAKPPCVPHFVVGVINWRGSLITVVDLMKFFHPGYLETSGEFIIVINANEITLGILACSIEGGSTFQHNQLSTPLSSIKVANPEYILGLHQATTAILNVDALVSRLNQTIKENIYRIGDPHGSK